MNINTKRISGQRLQLVEVKKATMDELLHTQHRIAVSKGEKWEILSFNRDIIDREIERRGAIEALDRQVAKYLAKEAAQP